MISSTSTWPVADTATHDGVAQGTGELPALQIRVDAHATMEAEWVPPGEWSATARTLPYVTLRLGWLDGGFDLRTAVLENVTALDLDHAIRVLTEAKAFLLDHDANVDQPEPAYGTRGVCDGCGLEVEYVGLDTLGDAGEELPRWQDRGGNTRCPDAECSCERTDVLGVHEETCGVPSAGQLHAPA